MCAIRHTHFQEILWPTLLTLKSDDRFPMKYRIPGKLNW